MKNEMAERVGVGVGLVKIYNLWDNLIGAEANKRYRTSGFSNMGYLG